MRDRARAVSVIFLIIIALGAAPVCRTTASPETETEQARSIGLLMLQGVGRDTASLNGEGSHRLVSILKYEGRNHQGRTREFLANTTSAQVRGSFQTAAAIPDPFDSISNPIHGQAHIRAP